MVLSILKNIKIKINRIIKLNLLSIHLNVELLWRAPELLRDPDAKPTKEGDIYSAGIIIQEIVLRSGPFEKEKSHMEVSGLCIFFENYK